MIPNIIKRILEVPGSTPTLAIIHDAGIVDIDLEVEMERIILASDVMQMEDSRISKKLLGTMMAKGIPGFCTSLSAAMKAVGVENLDVLKGNANQRKVLKSMLVKVQRQRLVDDMMKASKTDSMLLNFSYDGYMKKYLIQLPFQEARMVFMLRARMFPTKCNFPKRWSQSNLCTFCCETETDEHLFTCCGFMDIHRNNWNYDLFMALEAKMEILSEGARVLLAMHERLLEVNEDVDVGV